MDLENFRYNKADLIEPNGAQETQTVLINKELIFLINFLYD